MIKTQNGANAQIRPPYPLKRGNTAELNNKSKALLKTLLLSFTAKPPFSGGWGSYSGESNSLLNSSH